MSARRHRFTAAWALCAGLVGCSHASDAPHAETGAATGAEREAPAGAWPVVVAQPESAHPQYERVVLVTLDTLRADHVSCYGYPRATTPFLDSLAARGARFTRAYAAVSHTAPSHATMLTGLVPAVHGVLKNGGQLDPAAADLAESFAQAGFESAAFLNVKFLSGIAASFGRVVVRAVASGPGKARILTGADVVDAAIRWLEHERKSERFLLWVHLYDPHKWKDRVLEHEGSAAPIWTGATPAHFFELVAAQHGLPEPVPGQPYQLAWNVEKRAGETLEVQSAEGFLRCIDAYDELIHFADAQLERLYRDVEGLALPGRTLWVVTADHGEGLASHGVAGHGGRIYQEQLHVPLVLHASDGSLGPLQVDELVAHVDLLPTLVATLGASVTGRPGLYEGRSLWPLLRAGGAGAGAQSGWTPRPLFAQRRPTEEAEDPDLAEVFALQDERHKYILHEPGDDEFFDLASDPHELVNLWAADPGAKEASAAAELRAALEQRLRVYRALSPTGALEDVPEDWMQELRDLGYVR